MDLLCIDFMNVDPSKDGEKHVLVMMDAFSKLRGQLLHQTNGQKL